MPNAPKQGGGVPVPSNPKGRASDRPLAKKRLRAVGPRAVSLRNFGQAAIARARLPGLADLPSRTKKLGGSTALQLDLGLSVTVVRRTPKKKGCPVSRIRKAAAAIYGWDSPLLTFTCPGFDCDSTGLTCPGLQRWLPVSHQHESCGSLSKHANKKNK